jgi:hypothetical protein
MGNDQMVFNLHLRGGTHIEVGTNHGQIVRTENAHIGLII